MANGEEDVGGSGQVYQVERVDRHGKMSQNEAKLEFTESIKWQLVRLCFVGCSGAQNEANLPAERLGAGGKTIATRRPEEIEIPSDWDGRR